MDTSTKGNKHSVVYTHIRTFCKSTEVIRIYWVYYFKYCIVHFFKFYTIVIFWRKSERVHGKTNFIMQSSLPLS